MTGPARQLFRLFGGQGGQRLSDADQSVAVFGNIVRRAAFVSDMLGNIGSGDHIDRVPGAPALAQNATDATLQIDVAESLQARLVFAGHLIDAIDATDFNTGFAAGAAIRPDDSQLLGKFFSRLTGAFSHENLFRLVSCRCKISTVGIFSKTAHFNKGRLAASGATSLGRE